jgi:hypothetical protein
VDRSDVPTWGYYAKADVVGGTEYPGPFESGIHRSPVIGMNTLYQLSELYVMKAFGKSKDAIRFG